MRGVGVPPRGVDEVVGEDGDDLEPPVDDRATRQDLTATEATATGNARRLGVVGRSGQGRGAHGVVLDEELTSSTRRLPTANAGAPSRLTSSIVAYQARPRPTAWPVEIPSGWRRSTNIPSRIPRPDSEIGTTWAMATTGMNATSAAKGTPEPSERSRKPTVAMTETW